jgi:hypothetical protein
MDDGIRSELTALRDTMSAGFARMDRYFELQQAQHLELRAEVREIRDILRGIVRPTAIVASATGQTDD